MLFAMKTTILVLAVMSAYVLRMYYVRPKILHPHCLIDTNSCVELEYYTKENSAFVIVRPSMYRLWFNGKTFYVYDVFNTGRTCENPDYQPAYEIQPTQSSIQNYHCVRSIAKVFEYYKDTPKNRDFIRVDNLNDFSVYDVIRYLLNKRIVGLPTET